MSASQEYIYCPFCASLLIKRIEEGDEYKYCFKCKWTYYPAPHIAVAAIIAEIRPDLGPCTLMVRRKREPFKDTWMFPAGFLKLGEHPEEDTLPRETKEEVGKIVIKSRLVRILKSTSDPRSPSHLVLFYQVQTTGEIVNNDTAENSDIQWKPINSTVNIGFPHHQKIFEDIKSNTDSYFDRNLKTQ